MRRSMVAVGLLGLLGACADPPPPGPPGAAVVVAVVDGDTVDVEFGHRRERVRLIGIDTPETRDPRRPVGCFGPEAAAFTASLLPPGTAVVVERDAEARDDYGRLLGYLTRRADGLAVNVAIARQGFARALTIAPNDARAADIAEAVRAARHERAGLWGACLTDIAVAPGAADPG